jgi:hypothetical protein
LAATLSDDEVAPDSVRPSHTRGCGAHDPTRSFALVSNTDGPCPMTAFFRLPGASVRSV